MHHRARLARLMVAQSNVTPVWLLIFWRLVKGEAMGDYAVAWKALPSHLPPSVKMPTVDVAAVILADHGLTDR